MMYKRGLLLISLVLMLLACNKSEPKSLIENRKAYLAGVGNAINHWKLKGLTSDAIPQILVGSQLSYNKQYFNSSSFTDTDGASGNWSIPVADSLKEIFANYPSGIIVKQSYYINFLSYDSLSLTYVQNGKIINARFKAAR